MRRRVVGEQVEIDGSFRLPAIIEAAGVGLSGARVVVELARSGVASHHLTVYDNDVSFLTAGGKPGVTVRMETSWWTTSSASG